MAWERIANFISGFFAALNERGVAYCVLRGYEGLPERPGRDIDIFIEDRAGIRDEVIGAVRGLGWDCIEKCSSEGFFTLACCSLEGECAVSLQLDLWTKLLLRGVEWADGREILSGTGVHNGIRVAAPGAEAAVTSVKEFMGGGSIKEKYRERLSALAEADGAKFAAVLSPAFGEKAGELRSLLAAGDLEGANRLGRGLKKALFKKRPFRYLGGSVRRVFEKLFAGRKKPGMLAAFVGPDGSGKTTIIEKQKELLAPFFENIAVYHMRYNILPELKTGHGFSSMKGRVNSGSAEKKPVKRSLISKLASWFVVLYYTFEFMLGNHLIRRAGRKNTLVLYDRYYYDHFIQPTTRELVFPFRKFLLALVAKPDIVIHLNADPEVVYARKQELSVREIAAQNEAIARLVKGLPFARTVETGTKTVDEIAKEVFALTVETLGKKREKGRK